MCGFVPTRGIGIDCNGSNINPVAVNLLRVKLPDGNYHNPGSGTSGTQFGAINQTWVAPRSL